MGQILGTNSCEMLGLSSYAKFWEKLSTSLLQNYVWEFIYIYARECTMYGCCIVINSSIYIADKWNFHKNYMRALNMQ